MKKIFSKKQSKNNRYYHPILIKMLDPTTKVFGNIKAMEIIGTEPSLDVIRIQLESEFNHLLESLKSKSNEQLTLEKNNQIQIEKEVNSRPGAMALSQSKIKLFCEYSDRYIKEINNFID